MERMIIDNQFDAFCRKIAGGVSTLYYYNDQWQVLQVFDGNATMAIYGNYID